MKNISIIGRLLILFAIGSWRLGKSKRWKRITATKPMPKWLTGRAVLLIQQCLNPSTIFRASAKNGNSMVCESFPDMPSISTPRRPRAWIARQRSTPHGSVRGNLGRYGNIHPNAKTGAHHHGALESVIYVVRGRARMRWGEHLEFVAEAGPGDFIFVPPYVPHQEINASPDEVLECVLVRSDNEAVVVNLDITPVERPRTFRGLIRSTRVEPPCIFRWLRLCLDRTDEFRSGAMATGLNWRLGTVAVSVALVLGLASSGMAADEPDLIFKRSTVFKWLTPNDKLATYGLDDPEVDGVACHFTVPERGGLKGWLGVAEEVSDISLACRQLGRSASSRNSPRAMTCFVSAAPCSSKKCKLCVAATPSEMFWSIWYILIN